MKYFLFVLLIFTTYSANSQNRNSVWCFGDSAGIDFSSGIPVPIESGMDSRGSCASIADTNGNLLFYAATMRAYASVTSHSTFVYDANNNIMQNGDSIVGRVWYQELVIVPNPALDSTYYLFSLSVTENYGICYSIIDMRLNGGLGAVTVKNIQLQNFEQVDCINAVKHGNGRDWWLFFRKSDFSVSMSNNDYYSYLITPDSIQNFSVQTIGVQNRTNNGHIIFSPNADKLVFINLLGVVELFDFDRCTGLLSNHNLIESDPGIGPYPYTWSCEFSPDASKLYISTDKDTCYLYQYDLNAANVSASKDTLWFTNFPENVLGSLKLGPDNKIYLCNQYFNGFNVPYPYADSVYNMYNMNLSVINQPDSLGISCDFQPYSYYLGGKRAYKGLPNNPDYEMPALLGSSCDTIVGISEEQPTILNPQLSIFYHNEWQTAFINANNLTGTKGTLEIFDVQGKMIHQENIQIVNGYYTRNFNMTGMADGMYFVNLITEGKRLSGKLVKN